MRDEMTFEVTPENAGSFCGWLIAIGGWAPAVPVEMPTLIRLIRAHNPENKVGIPRMDLVITNDSEAKTFQIRREFHPLYQAWLAYDLCRYREA